MKNKLKKKREEKKITQEQLARMVNVSNMTIYRIEKTLNTDVKTVIKIAKILECNVEEIFDEN